MTRLGVWDRAALGLVSIHMHGSIPVRVRVRVRVRVSRVELGLVEYLV